MDFLSAAADDDVASVFGIKQKDRRTHRTYSTQMVANGEKTTVAK